MTRFMEVRYMKCPAFAETFKEVGEMNWCMLSFYCRTGFDDGLNTSLTGDSQLSCYAAAVSLPFASDRR
jgi:hypothetical protein